MTNKPKRKSGTEWLDRLMPASTPVHFISPLPINEIVDILNGLGTENKVLVAKVVKVETSTGAMYKFSISQRYAMTERHGKIIVKGGLGDPTKLAGELKTHELVSGVLQGIANNQSMLTFSQEPSAIGCILIAWTLFFFIGVLALPFTATIKVLLSILVFLLGVLAYLFVPNMVNRDDGFNFAPGTRLGNLMVNQFQVQRLRSRAIPPKSSPKTS